MNKLKMDKRGFVLSLPILIIGGILAFLGMGVAATINWQFLLAVMAMGIIGIAFLGVVFFKADFKLVIYASIISIAIVFIVEVTFPVLVGGIIAIFAMWNFKYLKGKPLILFALVATGLAVMLFGATLVLAPMGVFP